MNVITTTRALGFVAALSLATWAHASPLTMFAADFEGDLSGWTEREPANPSGLLVADPVGAGHGRYASLDITAIMSRPRL